MNMAALTLRADSIINAVNAVKILFMIKVVVIFMVKIISINSDYSSGNVQSVINQKLNKAIAKKM
ncbi:MAG: hypothetical protein BHV69_09320 [Bacteroidales bacterium 52_46]|nr:MAG: hypothetical protein BHV69_09320 [Bacteroidales bacterium 52_46]